MQCDPKPFSLLAKELFPGQYSPTPTHHFIRLLHGKGLLLRFDLKFDPLFDQSSNLSLPLCRCFSQNIDSLETQAGLPRVRKLNEGLGVY